MASGGQCPPYGLFRRLQFDAVDADHVGFLGLGIRSYDFHRQRVLAFVQLVHAQVDWTAGND